MGDDVFYQANNSFDDNLGPRLTLMAMVNDDHDRTF